MGKSAVSTVKPANVHKCNICGKILTHNSSVSNSMGHKCATLQAQYTAKQLIAHKKRYTLANVPNGYVKTAIMHKRINTAKSKGIAVTVSSMVRAFGGDRGLGTLANPICRFWYIANNKARYVHPWFASANGLQALATNNYKTAPTAPTKTQLVKALKTNATFSA